MARRLIIGEILNLIKDIGGNPNKFMGTKTNINFLGKGPKESLFQGAIDAQGMQASNFPLTTIISEAESAGGYATANKLNDLQLQRLKDNLIQLKKAYVPEQVPNITDLASGTGDLTQEGIASLREGVKRFPKESHQFMGRPLKDADFAKIDQLVAEGKLPAAEGTTPLMTRIQERMNKIKGMADDLGRGDVKPTYQFINPSADRASYASKFNPNNEIHVHKAEALLKDPQMKGLYTEAEVKNAYDFEGLYLSHFDKGHVDIARLFEQAGHNVPQMRSAARDALLQLTKVDDAVPFAEIDIKYITEGGGGREGDPINLMVKYFGKNVTENLPKDATKDSIGKFTEFLMRAKDSRGRGINDPFFDRETIEFTGALDDIPFRTGGRVGFKYGSRTIAKGALAFLKKNKKNSEYMFKASDNVSPGYAKGDTKYNAELLAEQLADDAGVVYDDLDHIARSEFYGTAYDYLSHQNQMFRQMKNIFAENRQAAKDYTQLETLKGFDVKGRKPSASGGLAKILEV